MKDIIVQNYLLFTSLVGLLGLLLSNRTLSRKTIRIFEITCVTIGCLLVCEILDCYWKSFDTLQVGRVITSSLGYILRPFVLLLFVGIVNRRKRLNKIWAIFMLIEALFVITGQFTHLVVYFDEGNYFHRGILGYLPHLLSLFFMVFMFYSSFVNHRKVDKLETGVITYVEIVCVSAIILETVFSYSFLLITAMTFSVILYYVFLNTQLNKRDALTGVLNRRCFYLEAEYYKNAEIAIVLCDMNGLKKINDAQGHNAGDKAICAMSDALCSATVHGFKVYRVGGDEFVVIGIQKNDQDVSDYIDKAKLLLKKTPYQVSFGYAIYHPGDDFDEICRVSDERMYEDKRIAKESMK